MIRIVYIFFICILMTLPAIPKSFAASAPKIRGVEKEESYPADLMRNISSAAFYAPRQALNGGLWGLEKTGAALSDPDFIEKVEDILYLYKEELLWFPIASYTSNFRPEYGAGLYYRNEAFQHLFRAMIHDSKCYTLDLKLGYETALGNQKLRTSIKGVLEENDDFRFYGIGGNPKRDPRNHFITERSEQEYGVFSQGKRKLQWDANLDLTPNYGVGYLGYYQRKNFRPSGHGKDPLQDVFGLASIPGFTNGSPVTQVYNEISVFIDTRNNKKKLSPGTASSIYAGLSNGLHADKSDLLRLGGDAALILPVRTPERIVMLRAIFDHVDAYHGEIPFTEYSHDLAFRGIASNQFIRNDKASLQPSLEYQWRLSEALGAHWFVDYLTVGKTFTKLDWNHGAWATGFGLDLRWRNKELGRIELAGGSEGFQASLSLNKPLKRNSRSKWR